MSKLLLRHWHSYVGLFIAPSVLLFACTGAIQLFGLHEGHGRYKPPALIEKLGSVHTDQEFKLREHHAAPEQDPSPAPPKGAPPADDDEAPLNALLLKWFFLGVSVCLVGSTSVGVWMGVTQTRNARLAWTLLLIGALVPSVLLLL